MRRQRPRHRFEAPDLALSGAVRQTLSRAPRKLVICCCLHRADPFARQCLLRLIPAGCRYRARPRVEEPPTRLLTAAAAPVADLGPNTPVL